MIGMNGKRLGRPPRVTIEDIARVTIEIGFERADLKSVAERLGVSLKGVYYHVRNRDDLLERASSYAYRQMFAEIDAGRSFGQIVMQFSEQLYLMCSKYPDIIRSVYAGVLYDESAVMDAIAPFYAQILKSASLRGLSEREAFEVFALMSASALGAATIEASRRSETAKPLRPFAEGNAKYWVASDRNHDPHRAEKIDCFGAVQATFDGLKLRYGAALD